MFKYYRLFTDCFQIHKKIIKWLFPGYCHTAFVLSIEKSQTLNTKGASHCFPAHRWWSFLSIPRRWHSLQGIKGMARDRCHQKNGLLKTQNRKEQTISVSGAELTFKQATCSLQKLFCYYIRLGSGVGITSLPELMIIRSCCFLLLYR